MDQGVEDDVEDRVHGLQRIVGDSRYLHLVRLRYDVGGRLVEAEVEYDEEEDDSAGSEDAAYLLHKDGCPWKRSVVMQQHLVRRVGCGETEARSGCKDQDSGCVGQYVAVGGSFG